MTRAFIITILSLLSSLAMPLHAKNDKLLNRLDSVINESGMYTERKLQHIDFLKKSLATEREARQKLRIYHSISSEYHVLQFDSAMKYVDKGLSLAMKENDRYYTDLNIVKKSELLAIGGLYSEAKANLDRIDTVYAESPDSELPFRYNFTYFLLYSYWADYCNDNTHAPEYRNRAAGYLRKAIALLDKRNPNYDYYMGEYYIYVERNDKKAMEHYLKMFDKADIASREYAMAAFAIANNYSAHNRMDKYEEYLIKACISDVVCCTKENLALQDLAIYLFEKDSDNVERAEKYINASLADARMYNSRLRILEISHKLPAIVTAYQKMIKERNNSYELALVFISVLLLGFVVSLGFIARQNKLLSLHRRELSDNNRLLTDTNDQLCILNEKLIDTNSKREGLAKIYIDLCAKYIDRLAKFQTLVKRKIKANQAAELLTNISSARFSEEEAGVFLNRFDKAFLDLYPTFVEEFNALLEDDQQIIVKETGQMTAELRIFALIRLGVKDSSEIAALLFYSPQTIYNYRSSVKGKAKNKETFDNDVMSLCRVIKL